MWIKMAAVGRLLPGSIDHPVAMRRLHGENRIVRDSNERPLYGHLMWRALASWAPNAGVPASKRRVLVRSVMESWLRLPEESRNRMSGQISAVQFLTRLAVSEPWLVATTRYWRQLGRAMGGSAIRKAVSRAG